VAKKFERVEAGKKIAGVCTGLAEYANLDVTLVRVIFIVLVLGFGSAILAYLILWMAAPIVPVARSAGSPPGGGAGTAH
jgi:phage shock protein C